MDLKRYGIISNWYSQHMKCICSNIVAVVSLNKRNISCHGTQCNKYTHYYQPPIIFLFHLSGCQLSVTDLFQLPPQQLLQSGMHSLIMSCQQHPLTHSGTNWELFCSSSKLSAISTLALACPLIYLFIAQVFCVLWCQCIRLEEKEIYKQILSQKSADGSLAAPFSVSSAVSFRPRRERCSCVRFLRNLIVVDSLFLFKMLLFVKFCLFLFAFSNSELADWRQLL